jgi:hypothetical protein
MKVNELNALIESVLTSEVKRKIMEQVQQEGKTVYHIMCDGEPVDTFDSEEEAKEHVDKLKKDHPGKQFIIEKTEYESHDDMLDKLDEMGEKLENESENMKHTETKEGNAFSKAVVNAKKHHEKSFEVGGHHYDVKEDDDVDEGNAFSGALANAKKHHEKSFEVGGKEFDVEENWEDPTGSVGTGDLSVSEEECDECGMYESKKKKIRLKESELVSMIKDMINEAMKGEPGVPGIPGVYNTEKAQKGSGKENKDALAAVDKKMKDYLNFDGNDHSEFPHQNGVKTKKAAYENTKEQDEETARNFAGLENLDYDLVDEKFKDRMKKAIEGHSTMGNAPTTEKASIKPSNGADKGKEAKEKEGNHIQTPETAKKINKQVKDRQEDKENRVLYPKEKIPVSESKVGFTSILNEEVEKMKKLYTYNKKTQ